MALEREMATFQRELPRLLAEGHDGHFAVVQGDRLRGIHEERGSAVSAGFEEFGLTPFLVVQVHESPAPGVVTRLSCPASRSDRGG